MVNKNIIEVFYTISLKHNSKYLQNDYFPVYIIIMKAITNPYIPGEIVTGDVLHTMIAKYFWNLQHLTHVFRALHVLWG